jgi:hypothetical protein
MLAPRAFGIQVAGVDRGSINRFYQEEGREAAVVVVLPAGFSNFGDNYLPYL